MVKPWIFIARFSTFSILFVDSLDTGAWNGWMVFTERGPKLILSACLLLADLHPLLMNITLGTTIEYVNK